MISSTSHRYVRRAAVAVGTSLIGSLALVGAATTPAQADIPGVPTCTITLAPPAGLPAVPGTQLTATATIGLNGLTVVTPIVTASIVPVGSTTPLALLGGALSPGGNQVTYLLTNNDVGKQLVALGDLTSLIPAIPGVPSLFQCTSTPVTIVSPPSTGGGGGSTTLGATPVSSTPRVVGKTKVRKTVRADLGAVQPGVVATYQWFKQRKHHAARAIAGATGGTFKIKKGIRGKKLSVVVTYVKAGYSATVLGSPARRVK